MKNEFSQKHHSGRVAYHGGLAAEQAVERAYLAERYVLLARRWRGKGGEIDLIFGDGNGFVFVEVKKSRSFEQAALRLSHAQRRRIFAAATEYVASKPDGQLSRMRFDVALCDSVGAVHILENALFCD